MYQTTRYLVPWYQYLFQPGPHRCIVTVRTNVLYQFQPTNSRDRFRHTQRNLLKLQFPGGEEMRSGVSACTLHTQYSTSTRSICYYPNQRGGSHVHTVQYSRGLLLLVPGTVPGRAGTVYELKRVPRCWYRQKRSDAPDQKRGSDDVLFHVVLSLQVFSAFSEIWIIK